MVERLPSPDSSSQKTLRALYGSSAEIRKRIDDFHASLMQHSQKNGEWESLLHHVIDTIPGLNSEEYRSLVGFLNTGRKRAASPMRTLLHNSLTQNPSEKLQHLVQSLQNMHALLNQSEEQLPGQTIDPFAHKGPMTDASFAQQALLLIRSIYPFGINVLNPSWTKGVPQSFDATETLTFQPGFHNTNDTVIVRPKDKDTSIIEYSEKTLIPGPGQWVRHTRELHDGSSLLIGRILDMPAVFDRKIPVPPIEPDCDVGENEHFSRAGILLVREKGRLYLFDRGCRAPIVFNQRNGMSGTYAPESRQDDKGHWTHGDTVMVEGPRKQRSDEHAHTLHHKENEEKNGKTVPEPKVTRDPLPDIISEQSPGDPQKQKPWFRKWPWKWGR